MSSGKSPDLYQLAGQESELRRYDFPLKSMIPLTAPQNYSRRGYNEYTTRWYLKKITLWKQKVVYWVRAMQGMGNTTDIHWDKSIQASESFISLITSPWCG